MAKQPMKPQPSAEAPSEEYLRFERMTSALFRVDKRDVPKHEPKPRTPKSENIDTKAD
jgi:hypothetical protein